VPDKEGENTVLAVSSSGSDSDDPGPSVRGPTPRTDTVSVTSGGHSRSGGMTPKLSSSSLESRAVTKQMSPTCSMVGCSRVLKEKSSSFLDKGKGKLCPACGDWYCKSHAKTLSHNCGS